MAMSGSIIGAALISHHPGLMQSEDVRRMQGAGQDSDLIAGYARMRERLVRLKPDAVVVFDTHWFTTGYHLVDAADGYRGTFISDEMPWYLYGVPYDYRGCPELAYAIEEASRERNGYNRAIRHPDLGRHYATVNLVKQLRLELSNTPVVSISSCQNCRWEHYLESGQAVAEGIARSGLRVVLLASGALSHRFNDIDWKPVVPRLFDARNVSSEQARESDRRAIERLCAGRHDQILADWDTDYRRQPWEAFGAHYLQMVGAMGGAECRVPGLALSEYENARGTGNIHLWFEP